MAKSRLPFAQAADSAGAHAGYLTGHAILPLTGIFVNAEIMAVAMVTPASWPFDYAQTWI